MRVVVLAVMCLSLLAACNNLRFQPKYTQPYDESEEFGTAWRPLDENAVPIGYANVDTHLTMGLESLDGAHVDSFPFEITAEDMAEGQRQYEAFCAMCHGYGGYGDGVVALEGFNPDSAAVPASFHEQRLVDAEVGYYFDVITNGAGAMYAYDSRISVEDRWRVVAYIRALQLSQSVSLDALPESLQTNFGN